MSKKRKIKMTIEAKDWTLKCAWCNGFHDNSRCPRVKAFEYGENGAVTRVEFFEPWTYTLGPEMMADGRLGKLFDNLEILMRDEMNKRGVIGRK